MKSARLFKIERFMHRFALCGLAVALFAVPCFAQVQPGSTGGSIGKTDKSISGSESAGEPRTSTKRPIERGASDRSSEGSVAGRWRWTSDCTGGRWEGEFDLIESRGHISGNFAGTSWHDIGTITGQINGTSLTFTRKNSVTTQYWTGRLASGRLRGTFSGNASCSWQASRK
jgi:hypothetical protein